MNTKIPTSDQFLEMYTDEVAKFSGMFRKAFSEAGIWKLIPACKEGGYKPFRLQKLRAWRDGMDQASNPEFQCLLAQHL